eukprot:XP_001709782.1 Hypothetical protein GL50803_98682 [Giardia lamblia ATCC 50803]
MASAALFYEIVGSPVSKHPLDPAARPCLYARSTHEEVGTA